MKISLPFFALFLFPILVFGQVSDKSKSKDILAATDDFITYMDLFKKNLISDKAEIQKNIDSLAGEESGESLSVKKVLESNAKAEKLGLKLISLAKEYKEKIKDTEKSLNKISMGIAGKKLVELRKKASTLVDLNFWTHSASREMNYMNRLQTSEGAIMGYLGEVIAHHNSYNAGLTRPLASFDVIIDYEEGAYKNDEVIINNSARSLIKDSSEGEKSGQPHPGTSSAGQV